MAIDISQTHSSMTKQQLIASTSLTPAEKVAIYISNHGQAYFGGNNGAADADTLMYAAKALELDKAPTVGQINPALRDIGYEIRKPIPVSHH